MTKNWVNCILTYKFFYIYSLLEGEKSLAKWKRKLNTLQNRMKDTQILTWMVKPGSFILHYIYIYIYTHNEFYLQQLKVWNLCPNPFVLIFIAGLTALNATLCNTMTTMNDKVLCTPGRTIWREHQIKLGE